MSQTQEIIVYRNPMEKAMWDGMSSGDYFPIMVAAVVFIVVFIVTARGLERFVPWNKRKAGWAQFVLWAVPSVAAIITFNKLFI